MNVTIIPAAGRGKRMVSSTSKQFLKLGDRPVLAHTLQAFEDAKTVDAIIIVGTSKDLELCQKIVEKYGINKVIAYIIGGRRRQDSVYNGLKALPPETEYVIVHDGARPLVTPELIDRTVRAAKNKPAGTVGLPAKNTIKRVTKDDVVEYTLDRPRIFAIQTPQVFQTHTLVIAHRIARDENIWGTDDAMLVEKTGRPVYVIRGSEENIKITTPIDLTIAEAILAARAKKRSRKR